MQPSFRSIAIVGLGFSLLLVQSILGSVLTIHPFSPHLLLPIVLYVGVAPDVPLVRGAFVSFLLGYLLDLFSGNLMSLQTFICVATFVLARGAGLVADARRVPSAPVAVPRRDFAIVLPSTSL